VLPPKVVMSPIDFSDHSQDALNSAVALARTFGSEILLVHVVPAIPKLPSAQAFFHEAEYEKQLHDDAQAKLEQIASKISASGVKAECLVGTANDVSGELLRIAEHNDVDLIVIATHGMSGWRKLAFGSVTEKVVRCAECPVLVMRAQHESESEENTKTASAAVSL
jgi:nucleotide-binding universal stress UspA family protein